jgi:hypothetical protein
MTYLARLKQNITRDFSSQFETNNFLKKIQKNRFALAAPSIQADWGCRAGVRGSLARPPGRRRVARRRGAIGAAGRARADRDAEAWDKGLTTCPDLT